VKTAFLTLAFIGCGVSSADADREGDRLSATSLTATARATSGDTGGSTTSAGSPAVLSGEESYQTSRCPTPGNDPGLVIPAASVVQALACADSDYGLICHLAPELVVSITVGVDSEIFLVSCETEALYVIRWIAPAN